MQVKEKVNASNLLQIGMQTADQNGIRKTGGKTEGTDFASFLAQSKNTPPTQTKTPESGVKETDRVDSDRQNRDIPNQQTAKNKPVKRTEKPERTYAKADNNMAEDAENGLSDAQEEEIRTVVSEILQMLQSQLLLSPEQLKEALANAGMQAEELLTVDGLKEFFLQMQDAEVSDLLVNEELNQKWNDLCQDIEQLLPSEMDAELMKKVSELMETWMDMPVSEEEDSLMQGMTKQETMITGQSEENSATVYAEPEVTVYQKGSSYGNTSSNGQPKEHRDMHSETQFTEGKDTIETAGGRKEFANPILQAIQDAVNHVEDVEMPAQPVRGEEVIRQLVEQIRVNMNQDNTSLEMQLYPQHLGRIQINVVAKDGIMTARIVAETEAAKQAIEGGLTNLKESMQQQNLKVDAIEVMVSTTGFEQSNQNQEQLQQDNTSKNRRQLRFAETEEEIPKEDEAEAERMRAAGSSVSYTA